MTVLTQRMKAACSFVEKRVVLAHFNGSPPFRNILIMGAISMPSNAKLSTTRQYWVTPPSWSKALLQKFQKYQLLISTYNNHVNLDPEVDETTKATVRVSEITCHKAEPVSIAKSMMSKNSDGSLLFDASTFFVYQQSPPTMKLRTRFKRI